MEVVRVEIEVKTRSLIINHIQIILKDYYKTLKDSFLNTPTPLPTTAPFPNSTTTRMGPRTSSLWSRGSKTTPTSTMPTHLTSYKSRWTPRDSVGSGPLMGHLLARKTNTVTTSGKASAPAIWDPATITDHKAHNPTKVSGSMLRIDAPDQRLWKRHRTMETCSLFNRRIAWRIVHKLVKGKICFQRWSRTTSTNLEETQHRRVVWLRQPPRLDRIKSPKRIDQDTLDTSPITFLTAAARAIMFLVEIKAIKALATVKKRPPTKTTNTHPGGRIPSKNRMPCSLAARTTSLWRKRRPRDKRRTPIISRSSMRKMRAPKIKVKVVTYPLKRIDRWTKKWVKSQRFHRQGPETWVQSSRTWQSTPISLVPPWTTVSQNKRRQSLRNHNWNPKR